MMKELGLNCLFQNFGYKREVGDLSGSSVEMKEWFDDGSFQGTRYKSCLQALIYD